MGQLATRLTKAAGVASLLALSAMALTGNAWANCDVPIEPLGVTEDVAFRMDVGGTRAALATAGIGIGGAYGGEYFYNWGGFKEDGEYFGALHLYMNADMKELGLWDGLCFYMDGYQFHGVSITAADVGSLKPVSNFEATPTTRLFEIWFEQHMFNDMVSVKIGQIAVDTEFMLSEGGSHFINATWGWPSISASNLPGGGPAYPLSSPAVRVAVGPNDQWRFMAAVYNDDPAPPCKKGGGDPQRCNPHGLDFELDDEPLLFAQAQYSYNQSGLAGIIKVGGWNDFATFNHQRFDAGGNLIAVTSNDGRPLDNNWGLYAIVDQLVWRVPGSEEPEGVGVFARFIGSPADRNLVDFYFDGGFTFTGMIPGRPADSLAIGFGYTGISDQVSAFDVDFGEPIARNYEALLEICYTYEIKPGWSVQPDFQYIWQPGGNVSGQKDAAILGARTSLDF